MNPETVQAIHKFGRKRLADMVGVRPAAVTKWLKNRIPAERVLSVEQVTGISRHEIRPDIYPPDDRSAA